MARALISIQCHPKLVPRLTYLQQIRNTNCPFMSRNPQYLPQLSLTMASTQYPSSFYTKCRSFSRQRPLPSHSIGSSNDIGTERDEKEAIDTVVELFSAIETRNFQAFSSVIADDCKLISYFTPLFKEMQGKEEVVGFLIAMLRSMGEYMQFEIEESCYDEENVAVMWQLEWKGNPVPFGKGCTFFSCGGKNSEGKLHIRDVHMFMESIAKLGFPQLWLMGAFMMICSKFVNVALKWIGAETSV